MAIYKQDIMNVDLNSGSISRSFLNKTIGEGDALANRFGVRLYRGEEPVNAEDSECIGFFMAPDGTNLMISGSSYTGTEGNTAYVQLPQNCYAYEGTFTLAIKLVGGGITGTVRIVDGVVSNTGATGAVVPTSEVPTSAEIIAAYEDALELIDGVVRHDITQSLSSSAKAKARDNIEAAPLTNAPAKQNAYVGFYNGQPTFERSGTSIVVTFPRYARVFWNNGAVTTNTTFEQVTVPSANYLVFDTSTKTFSVVSASSSFDGNTIVCFYNSMGHIIGQWAVYDSADRFNLINAYIGFYGATPSFMFSGTTIYVTIPGKTRGFWNNGGVSDASASQTLTVPHNSYLVYNVASKEFGVVSRSEFDHNTVVCFYNSYGSIIGQWAVYNHRNSGDSPVGDDFEVPSYYFDDSYLTNKIASINTIGTGLGRQSGRAIFITDYHMEDNAKQSPALARYIMQNAGVRNVIFGGDAYNKDTGSKIGGYKKLANFVSQFETLHRNGNLYMITGNHEQNDPAANEPDLRISQEAVFQIMNQPYQNIINCFDGTNTFWFDDDGEKIRYYCIDALYNSAISDAAMLAVFSSLLTVPEGYAVIVFSHTGTIYTGSTIAEIEITGLTTKFEKIMRCFAAMNDGESVSIEVGSSTYTYDFTNKARTFIGAITGHIHVDGYYIYDDRFPVIAVACDTGAYKATWSGIRTAGTITEQAFDVVQFDVSQKKIYMTRIGWGNDRVFSFGENAGPITSE